MNNLISWEYLCVLCVGCVVVVVAAATAATAAVGVFWLKFGVAACGLGLVLCFRFLRSGFERRASGWGR